MDNEVLVTIWCMAYNHENYIRAALEGFVRQKTNFKFIALVHDDASTDGTANIIREYAEKYPDVIKPIYQKENQYGHIIERILKPQTHSKYVAICEGDDCWIDDYKLQKQVDALEAHPEVDICMAAAEGRERGKLIRIIKPYRDREIVPVETIIRDKGWFPATATMVTRMSARKKYWKFLHTSVGNFDYLSRVAFSLRGGMLFLGDVVSVYNMDNPGSWSDRNRKNRQAEVIFLDKLIGALEVLNEETGYKYNDAVLEKCAKERYCQCRINKDYLPIYQDKKLFKKLSLERRFRIFLKCFWR